MKLEIDRATEILSRTPSTLRALLRGLHQDWAQSNDGAGTWSAFDVVGHLIHGEKTDWISRARIILEQGEAVPFEPFDRFAMFEESRGKSLANLLDEFEKLRAENLGTLIQWRLQPSDLTRRGRHPELGPVTLGQLLATWVAHDLGHLAQIARVMASQYREEVGPWKAYLGVLDR